MGHHPAAGLTEVEPPEVCEQNCHHDRYQDYIPCHGKVQKPGGEEEKTPQADDQDRPYAFFDFDIHLDGKNGQSCTHKQDPEKNKQKNNVICTQCVCFLPISVTKVDH